MDENRYRETSRDDLAFCLRTHNAVQCASAAIVGEPLQEVGDIDQHRSRYWQSRLEFASMKWINL